MSHLLNHLAADDLERWGLGERLDALIERIEQANSPPAAQTEAVSVERVNAAPEVVTTEGGANPHA